MSIELKIPEVGESVTEVYIGKWYKAEGEPVEQDEQVVELESEKATLDLRAPAAGVLAKILRQTGDSAEVGEVIGRIEEGDGAVRGEEARETVKEEEPEAEEDGERGRRGEGERERMEREEVEEEPRREETRAKPRAEVAEPRRERAEPEATPVETKGRQEERVRMSPVRRRIALRLVEAQQNAALLTTFNEIDMSAVKAVRAQYGEAFERRHGVRLGLMSFFVKATIDALRRFPELNAMIDGEEIVYRRYYDIGVAISTEKGLVVPVLRDAERMGFAEIERAIADFAKRAREGDLKVEELQGGTFTITNGGVFGSLLSTPIVNPPQSGVLGMHALQDRPVARPSPRPSPERGGEYEVVVRPMMYVALTYDHRIVDGREAVTFLRRVKETIEEPARLLIGA